MNPVERLGVFEQISAFVAAIAASESKSLWPCYRGHVFIPLIPRFHESISPFAWPALGASKKGTDVVGVSAAPRPKLIQQRPPALVRAATALQANWTDAVRALREVAGRLNVHGEELTNTVHANLEFVQAMICERPSDVLSKAWQVANARPDDCLSLCRRPCKRLRRPWRQLLLKSRCLGTLVV